MTTLDETEGRVALVTGATSGIGAELAARLAGQGMHLVLVARTRDRLEAISEDLRSRHGVTVLPVAVDLAGPGAAQDVWRAVADAGLEVEMLVNNAGLSTPGPLTSMDPATASSMIAVNVTALTELTHHYLPEMVGRGRGTIINVASTGAYQPAPYLAVYAATKSYVLSLTQALAAETRSTGVRVLAVSPGPTDTPMNPGRGLNKRTSKQVVDTTLRALAGSNPSVVDGFANAVLARVIGRLLPERAMTGIAERILRPKDPDLTPVA